MLNYITCISLQKLREEILVMKKYFLSCKSALDSKLLLQVSHFPEDSRNEHLSHDHFPDLEVSFDAEKIVTACICVCVHL